MDPETKAKPQLGRTPNRGALARERVESIRASRGEAEHPLVIRSVSLDERLLELDQLRRTGPEQPYKVGTVSAWGLQIAASIADWSANHGEPELLRFARQFVRRLFSLRIFGSPSDARQYATARFSFEQRDEIGPGDTEQIRSLLCREVCMYRIWGVMSSSCDLLREAPRDPTRGRVSPGKSAKLGIGRGDRI